MNPLTTRVPKVLTVLVALVALALFAVTTRSADAAQEVVQFDQQQPQFAVEVDGRTTAIFDDEASAIDAAAQSKLADPKAFVLYRSEIASVASLDAEEPNPAPSPTPPPPTVQPTATTQPTAAPSPTAAPEPSATPEPTATVQPTATATPTPPTGLVWGYDATPPSIDWMQPSLGGQYVDAAYGTTVTRMTTADGTRFNRNTYSRRQAENADGSWFLTYHGDAAYHVYDRATGDLVRALAISPDSWPQWHPSDPTLIRHTADDNSYGGDLVLYQLDVISGTSRPLADLTEQIQTELPAALYMHDRAEGSPSADGNRWAWIIYDANEDVIGIASYDLSTDELHVLGADGFGDSSQVDWVSASPTGRYVMAGHWDGTWVYDHDLTNRRLVFAGGEHSDMALTADGRDAYVYIDFTASSEGGWLVSVELDTLAHTQIFDLYDQANTSVHISGKGYAKPGWVVASTYNCKVPGAWSCEKVMAVELAPNARVLNLAHTYNCGAGYWTETHAVVNTDFTRVYFNSDSGSCDIDAEVFMIQVPGFS